MKLTENCKKACVWVLLMFTHIMTALYYFLTWSFVVWDINQWALCSFLSPLDKRQHNQSINSQKDP